VHYIQLIGEKSKNKIPNGGDSDGGDRDGGNSNSTDGDGGDGNGGDGHGGDSDGGGGDDWKNGVDRMHAVWEICFPVKFNITHGNTSITFS